MGLLYIPNRYYEHVLGKPREYYEIQRPQKSKSLPNVFSKDEIQKILKATTNLKHKTILLTIYSAGLRISEVINLRIKDIHSDEGYIFIKDSKGKKDRKTILSPILLNVLRAYYIKHHPSYWLFEGQEGGKYSTKSIQQILRDTIDKSKVNPWGTVHTLCIALPRICYKKESTYALYRVCWGIVAVKLPRFIPMYWPLIIRW